MFTEWAKSDKNGPKIDKNCAENRVAFAHFHMGEQSSQTNMETN